MIYVQFLNYEKGRELFHCLGWWYMNRVFILQQHLVVNWFLIYWFGSIMLILLLHILYLRYTPGGTSCKPYYKSVQYFLRLESVLWAIYSHCIEKLKMLFNVLDKKFVHLQKVFNILCLWWLQAVKAVVSFYRSLVLYFDDAIQQ